MFVQSFFCVTLRCYQYYKTAIMGFIRKYKCVACGYEADIYEGKGFMGQTIEMVSCADCHSVQPILIVAQNKLVSKSISILSVIIYTMLI